MNTVTAYQRAKVSALKIVNLRIGGSSSTNVTDSNGEKNKKKSSLEEHSNNAVSDDKDAHQLAPVHGDIVRKGCNRNKSIEVDVEPHVAK